MNSNQLEHHLESQYDLVCFEDLATISQSPFTVYNLFYRHHKTEYKPNERLVFYSKETPNDALIEHIYRAANLIDISNFFILVIAPDAQSVVERNVEYSSDPVCFNFLNIKIDNSLPLADKFAFPDTLCPLPWMHLEIDAYGKVRPCCIYPESNFLPNMQNVSLQQIFQGTEMQQLREQFLQGKRITQCNGCWDMEDQGIISLRQRHLQLIGREYFGQLVNNPQITSLDIKPSNACNFKCRICGPGSSSLHAAEQAKHHNIIVKQSDYHVDKLFDQELPTLMNNLTNIDLYGGEPFFIKQILKFVKHCTDTGHSKHLRLHFNTNGSVYPEKIANCWQHFKHIDIQFSIDDLGERFELQRGGSWQQVESNIQRFIDLDLPNMSLNIMPAISIMNVFYIDELFEWAESLGLNIHPIMVEKPEEFCFVELTQQAKNAILDKYKKSKHPEIQKLYNVISKVVVKPNAGQQFKNKIDYFDSMRNESFQTSHYEIAKLMGMC